MAGVEWIKLYTNIVDHPKINSLRRLDNGNEIVFVWIMLLALAGRCNSDGRIFVTDGVPYSLAGLAYDLRLDKDFLADALEAMENRGMISTGVKEFPLLELTIKNWEKYQSTERLAELKEKDKLRKREERKLKKQMSTDSPRTVHGQSTDSPTIDKEIRERIETKNNKNNKGAGFAAVFEKLRVSNQLRSVLLDFIQMRKANKRPLTDKALELLITKLYKLSTDDEAMQIAIVNQSIENGWQGFFPLKHDRTGANGVKLSNEVDHTLDGIL